jgi:hypothetical protein
MLFAIAAFFLSNSPQTLSVACAQSKSPDDQAKSKPRALWVWQTEQLLNDSQKRSELFEFCIAENVGVIWLQLLYEIRTSTDGSPAKCVIRQPQNFRRLLREAHQASVKVHALDGYPEFALQEYHSIPIAVMQSLLAFNAESENKEEKFDGAHFDNEPYSLSGWQSPEIRKEIMTEFLVLNQHCQQLADTQRNFEFGIDIPVWWHQTAKDADPTIAAFAFDGTTQSLAAHCLEIVDNLGIMDYRDHALGADGIVEHAQPILEISSRKRTPIYVGLETFSPEPMRTWFALGTPRAEFESVLSDEKNELAWRSRYNNYRLRVFDDGKSVHVGLEFPDDQIHTAPDFQQALLKIVRTFGAGSRSPDELKTAAEFALTKLNQDAEFSKPRALSLKIDGINDPQPGLFASSVMLSKITFGDDSAADFRREVTAVEDAFKDSSRFAGIAIHSYEYARKLLSAETNE